MLPTDFNRRPATDAEVKNEHARITAEYHSLAREVRAHKSKQLQKALVGKMPGDAVDAMCGLAEMFDMLSCGNPLVSEHPMYAEMGATSADVFLMRKLAEVAEMMPLRYNTDAPGTGGNPAAMEQAYQRF